MNSEAIINDLRMQLAQARSALIANALQLKLAREQLRMTERELVAAKHRLKDKENG